MPRPAADKALDCVDGDIIRGTSNTNFNKNEPGYCWMTCAYSTANDWPQSFTSIVPGNKTTHTTTSGRMEFYTGGRWTCLDDACYYYVTNGKRFIYSGPETFS